MRWEDERYVRMYTRDTLTTRLLGWEGRAVLWELIRKVDRAGVVPINALEPVAALEALTGIPGNVCSIAWEKLREEQGGTGTVTLRETPLPRALILPNFMEAQEAVQSDAARARKARELARARDETVTSRSVANRPSRSVANRNVPSRSVTPSLAVPSRTEPKKEPAAKQPAASSAKFPVSLPRSATDHQALCAHGVQVIERATGVSYGFRDEDGNHAKGLLKRFGLDEARLVFELAAERYRADDWHRKRGLTFRIVANDANALRTSRLGARGPPPLRAELPTPEQQARVLRELEQAEREAGLRA